MTRAVLVAATLLVAAPSAAQAHLASTRFGDFYAGLLHPITALEHLLPLFALGLLAGLQEPRVARWILLAVPFGLLAGVAFAPLDPELAAPVWINRASFLVLGLLVALGLRVPAGILIALGTVFGLTHGYENGTVLGPDSQIHLFAFGAAAAGLICVALAAAGGVALSKQASWVRIGLRTAGSWIAAVGLLIVVV